MIKTRRKINCCFQDLVIVEMVMVVSLEGVGKGYSLFGLHGDVTLDRAVGLWPR